jgi:DNA replication ATP-dependent helicase Dna2
MRKTVLLTSFTHTAVDNVLNKLKEMNIDFVRIGTRDKIDPRIRQCLPDTSKMQSIKALDNYYRSSFVVATTAHGINQ